MKFPKIMAAGFVALIISLSSILSAAAADKTAAFTVLHINDVYEISPKRGKGGLAQLMTLLNKERSEAKNSITTLGGDLISPSIMSGLTKGGQMIDLMNALGVDLAVFGNHEFDFGPEVMAQHVMASKFKWLGTNVKASDGSAFAKAETVVIKQIDDLKVGFFGVLTPETTHLSSPGKTVNFAPVLESTKAAVKALKAQGADIIVALTHLDLAQDRLIAAKVRGIHVILGGHDHDPISILEGGTLILKAGYDAHYLAAADLKFVKRKTRRGDRVFMTPSWRFITTTGVAPDKEMADRIAVYEKRLDEKLNVVIGTTDSELDSRRGEIRTKETTMGNLITDALRQQTGADIALSNGGGIRGDRTYQPETKITRKDILGELPFGNVTVVLKMTGSDIIKALENGVSRIKDKAGRFLQVSGLTFKYDLSKPVGSRVVNTMVAGKKIDLTQTYSVATNDYIARGGDGFSVLKSMPRLVDASGGTLMATMVMDYIKAKGKVDPKVEGRIVGN